MKQRHSSKQSASISKILDKIKDEEIDTSDIPPVPLEMFAKGVVRRGLKPVTRKESLTLRVDSDVLAWFRGLGRGYQTTINELMRAYMAESMDKSAKTSRRATSRGVDGAGRAAS